MMPALFINTSSLGKLAVTRAARGGDLRRICDVALDRLELRVLRLHLIEDGLAPASNDDFVAQFEELEGESKADADGASGDKNCTSGKFHRKSFHCYHI